MKKILIGFFALSVMFCVSCGEETKLVADTSYDLSEYGIPATIMAPADAEITKSEVEGIVSCSVKKGIFGIDITYDVEPYSSLSETVAENITFQEEDESFLEFALKSDNGFIVKCQYEGDPNYEFFYIVENDNKQITIESSLNLFEDIKLEEAQLMYDAATTIKFN